MRFFLTRVKIEPKVLMRVAQIIDFRPCVCESLIKPISASSSGLS